MAGFDAAMFNTLKDIRERQDKLLAEQQRTNELLEMLVGIRPRPAIQQRYAVEDAGLRQMASGPWPPVQRP